MSQLILDDQADALTLVPKLSKWTTVQRLQELRPREHILDDRVPEILLTLSSPTFVTIDDDFWDRRLCNPGYSILFFPLQNKEQKWIPGMLRALFRHKGFATRAERMGKIARVSRKNVVYWEFQQPESHIMPWQQGRQRKKR
jgi:hypothetical protein